MKTKLHKTKANIYFNKECLKHKLTPTYAKIKQNKITALSKIETSKPNKWITLTYTGNETTRLARTIRKIDKNINIKKN